MAVVYTIGRATGSEQPKEHGSFDTPFTQFIRADAEFDAGWHRAESTTDQKVLDRALDARGQSVTFDTRKSSFTNDDGEEVVTSVSGFLIESIPSAFDGHRLNLDWLNPQTGKIKESRVGLGGIRNVTYEGGGRPSMDSWQPLEAPEIIVGQLLVVQAVVDPRTDQVSGMASFGFADEQYHTGDYAQIHPDLAVDLLDTAA